MVASLYSHRRRVWEIGAAVVLLGYALSTIGQDSLRRAYRGDTPPIVPPDFPHYYIAGRLARLQPPENALYYPPTNHPARVVTDLRIDETTPYGRPTREGGLLAGAVSTPFVAPPLVAMLMEPLSFLPWRMAYLVWQVSCVLMMMGSIFGAVHLARNGSSSIGFATGAFVAACLYYPFREALGLGNIDTALLLLWVWGAYLMRQGCALSSAFCFALGTALKINPVFAVPLFALRRQWRWLAGYVVWSAALLVISVWGVGWHNHVVWASQVVPALACGIKHYGNRSLAGLVLALNDPHDLLTFLPAPQGLCILNKALSGIGYASFLYWCWRRRRNAQGLAVELILLPLVVLVVSPVSWPQYFLLAVLPLIYLWGRFRDEVIPVSRQNFILLAAGSLTLGCVLPDYAGRGLGPPGELAVMGAWVAATLAILWVGLRISEGSPEKQSDPAG